MIFNASKDAYTANMTISEKEDIHKNWLYYDDDWMIDVPPALTSIIKFRATLGHKVQRYNWYFCVLSNWFNLQINHKFKDYNAEFVYLKHPVFGNVRGLAAVQNIAKNEEIFVDYQYDLKYDDTPQWYRESYKKFHQDSK